VSQREWAASWGQTQVSGWREREDSWGWARREMEPQASSPGPGCRLEGSQAWAQAWGWTASSQVLACEQAASLGWARRMQGWWAASSQVSSLGWSALRGEGRVWRRAQPERAGVALMRSLASWALAWERATARRESSRAPVLGWGCSHSRVGMPGGHLSR